MKIDEKIMKLRKKNAWSQEEFADKLNVSRQTVSKWELGQTIPDTDKLTKIASLFGISVNDLLDENSNLDEEKSKTNNSKSNPLKIFILIIVLIFVFLGIGAITINKIFNKITNQVVPKSMIEMFEQYSFSDIFNMIFGKIQESEKEFDKNGYINKEIIEDSESEDLNAKLDGILNASKDSSKVKMSKSQKDSFNSKFKTLYYGSTDGFFMNNFIDAVIKSNEENSEHIITITYAGTETSDANKLRDMKKKFTNGTTYEIIYEYDENGLINKAKIEK